MTSCVHILCPAPLHPHVAASQPVSRVSDETGPARAGDLPHSWPLPLVRTTRCFVPVYRCSLLLCFGGVENIRLGALGTWSYADRVRKSGAEVQREVWRKRQEGGRVDSL